MSTMEPAAAETRWDRQAARLDALEARRLARLEALGLAGEDWSPPQRPRRGLFGRSDSEYSRDELEEGVEEEDDPYFLASSRARRRVEGGGREPRSFFGPRRAGARREPGAAPPARLRQRPTAARGAPPDDHELRSAVENFLTHLAGASSSLGSLLPSFFSAPKAPPGVAAPRAAVAALRVAARAAHQLPRRMRRLPRQPARGRPHGLHAPRRLREVRKTPRPVSRLPRRRAPGPSQGLHVARTHDRPRLDARAWLRRPTSPAGEFLHAALLYIYSPPPARAALLYARNANEPVSQSSPVRGRAVSLSCRPLSVAKPPGCLPQ